ncbi:ABC transporter ATP-binding protein, partial [Myxococcota bacterium]|nr:ABC transporter ATP-binding protein [Myxococcota bacterium]
IGPNGAGKTTTIRLLLDLIRPTRGEAFLFGVPTGNPAIRARVGHLPGELSLDGRMSGIQTLGFLSRLDGHPRDEGFDSRQNDLCDRLGLTPDDLDRKVREYSRGMKQKLGLVAAFQHSPELHILDEPTTGLDPVAARRMDALIRDVSQSATVTSLVVSHDMNSVNAIAKSVTFLQEGRSVFSGTPQQLQLSPDATIREFLQASTLPTHFHVNSD